MIRSSPSSALEGQGCDQIGKARRNVLAGPRVESRDAPAVGASSGRGLHPDAVPFPFREEGRGIERGEIRLLDGVGEHRRAERRRIAALRPLCAALHPGKQLPIGRLEGWPHDLDFVGIKAAEGGDRGLGKPRRHADAQFAGDELQQRPAPGFIEAVEPPRQLRRQLALAEGGQRRDHVGKGWCTLPCRGRVGPPLVVRGGVFRRTRRSRAVPAAVTPSRPANVCRRVAGFAWRRGG
jgi:hypothetical protein